MTRDGRNCGLRQANLIGPAGFISMEDGAATGFVQRGARGADDEMSVVEMGGQGHRLGRKPRVGSRRARLLEYLSRPDGHRDER